VYRQNSSGGDDASATTRDLHGIPQQACKWKRQA